MVPKFGVLSQATKNKTYAPKNICSGVSKDCSHGEYLLREQGWGRVLSITKTILTKTTKEQFKLKYRNQSKEQTLV